GPVPTARRASTSGTRAAEAWGRSRARISWRCCSRTRDASTSSGRERAASRVALDPRGPGARAGARGRVAGGAALDRAVLVPRFEPLALERGLGRARARGSVARGVALRQPRRARADPGRVAPHAAREPPGP